MERWHEAYLPTKCSQASQEARLPRTYVDSRWARDHQESPAQGSTQAGCLIAGISDRAVFTAIRTNGRHVRSADLRFRYLPGEPEEIPQVAYSISRKVGSAVTRNRIRRRLRALFSEHFDDQAVAPICAGIVIVLPGAADQTFGELRTQVQELMKKVEKSTGIAAKGRRG